MNRARGKVHLNRFWLRAAILFLLSAALTGCALPRLSNPPADATSTAPLPAAPSPTRSLPAVATGQSPTSPRPTGLPSTNPTASTTPVTPQPGAPTATTPLPPTAAFSPTSTTWRWVTFTPIPTRTPTITPTPTPPLAALRILRPGAFSKLLSPIQVEASVSPGEDGVVSVDLLGEDGRTLARQRLNYPEYIDRSIAIAPKLEFKINGVAELGRLQISINDRYGRLAALTSTNLVLFSIGENDFNPPQNGMAPYIFWQPVSDQIIRGGILAVRGQIRPVNVNPVLLELLDEEGRLLANASLAIDLPAGALSHHPFAADLTYKVTGPTHARLVLRQESADRIAGTVALWSIALLLNP